MNQLSLRSTLVAVIALVVAFAAAYTISVNHHFAVQTAEAQTVSLPASLLGFAWSSTIGWISFNCANPTQTRNDADTVVANHPNGTCADVGYGVEIDSSGNLSGHAWSSNIGWIQFGGLSDFPTANGNPGGNAQLVSAPGGYELQGWARACAGTASGDCSTMSNSAVSGGWDGWISLKGVADDGGSYRLYFQNGTPATADADTTVWGSEVVGWVKAHGSLVIEPDPDIGWFTATPEEVELGEIVTLEWSISGMSSCAASNNRGQADWNGGVSATNGVSSQSVTPPRETTVYTLNCTGSDGSSHQETVSVLARPNIDITALSCMNCDSDDLPAPNASGNYDGIQFTTVIDGIPGGETAPYRFQFAGQDVTGSVGPGTNSIVVNNVPFGTHSALLEVDLPAPGSMTENLPSTAVNEDAEGNSLSVTPPTILPSRPEMSLIPTRNPIRYRESTDIGISVTAVFPAECEVIGNGISESFTTVAGVAFATSYPTPSLESTSVYRLTCTETTTNTSFTEEVRIEVVPEVEEI